ncbi:hypothetical protein [Streptomyces mayteni]
MTTASPPTEWIPPPRTGARAIPTVQWWGALVSVARAVLARLFEPDTDVTLVTGLEGPVDLAEPVTCRYCRHDIVADDDHAPDCTWRPGRAAAR